MADIDNPVVLWQMTKVITVKYKKNEHAQLNIHYHRKSLKKSFF